MKPKASPIYEKKFVFNGDTCQASGEQNRRAIAMMFVAKMMYFTTLRKAIPLFFAGIEQLLFFVGRKAAVA
jgi:hypothetical protein